MRPLMQAFPGALAELLRDAPLSPGKVSFAWRAAVGVNLARATSVKLDNRILIVEAVDPRWAREVTHASSLILSRLRALLGADTIERLIVREL